MAVVSILESGLLFEPPAGTEYFRLEQAPEFARFKGIGVCEMDFGWCGGSPGGQTALWLLEVRDYSGRTVDPAYLKHEFVEKAKDSLLVLGSVWHGLPRQAELRPCLPQAFQAQPTPDRKLKLVFVLKVDDAESFRAAAQPLQDSLRNRLKGHCDLLGVSGLCDILLLDHTTAINQGLPLRVDSSAFRPTTGRRHSRR